MWQEARAGSLIYAFFMNGTRGRFFIETCSDRRRTVIVVDERFRTSCKVISVHRRERDRLQSLYTVR